MKKGIFVLAVSSIFALSCSKNAADNSKGSLNDAKPGLPSDYNKYPTNPKNPVNPLPVPTPVPEPPKPEEKMEKIKFGTDGLVTLNTETKEYTIDKIPTNKPDFDFLQPSKGLFDSFVLDPNYVYKSSLFPVDRYSLYQIPDVVTLDKENTILGQQAVVGKYNATLTFWGSVGKFPGRSYYACYKSIGNNLSKLDFIIDGLDKSLENTSCTELKPMIDQGKVKPLSIKGGDYIMLRFYGFRAYSDGDCFDYRYCVISYNSNVKYYTQIK